MTKLICALDTDDLQNALEIAQKVKPYIDLFKLGLEFFTSCGPKGVEIIAALDKPIFLDLKLHDIPNTVLKALRVIKKIPGVSMTTIHILGGAQMMQFAKKELLGSGVKLFGVTLLTSLKQEDLQNISVDKDVNEYIKNLALFAKTSGLDGVVCSLKEVDLIKKACGQNFLTITPGVGNNKDQKRSVLPDQIKNYNTDYIVAGRIITNATNPQKAAKDLFDKVN